MSVVLESEMVKVDHLIGKNAVIRCYVPEMSSDILSRSSKLEDLKAVELNALIRFYDLIGTKYLEDIRKEVLRRLTSIIEGRQQDLDLDGISRSTMCFLLEGTTWDITGIPHNSIFDVIDQYVTFKLCC